MDNNNTPNSPRHRKEPVVAVFGGFMLATGFAGITSAPSLGSDAGVVGVILAGWGAYLIYTGLQGS